MTNADKIRAMTDEELANNMYLGLACEACPLREEEKCLDDCIGALLKWLKEDAE